ncbi:MAG: DUF1360 domain-containing protein [bacterium]|nr:DUF1360 domain-containing protein [bacterium]
MEALITAGLTAGVIVVILCTASIAEPLRKLPFLGRLLDCPFCTSIWVSLAIAAPVWKATFAIAAIANFTVLLIHWSMAGYDEETNS